MAEKALGSLGDKLDVLDRKLQATKGSAAQLNSELNQLGRNKATPKVELHGQAEAIAGLKAVQHELDKTQRTARMPTPGGGSGRGGGMGNGRLLLGMGGAALGAFFKGWAKWLTLSPLIITAVTALAGAVTALAASLTAAAGGAALVGGGILGMFAVGIGSVASFAIPAIKQLKAYDTAVKSLNKAMASGNPAAIKTAQQQVNALAKQHPGVAKLSQEIHGMGAEWKRLTKAGRGEFFKTAADGVKLLRGQLPLLAHEANLNMKAIHGGLNTFGQVFKSATFTKFFRDLNHTFRVNVQPMAKGLRDIAIGVMRLLDEALPHTTKMADGFARIAHHFRAWTSTPGAKKWVHDMIDSMHRWWQLLKAAVGLLAALFAPARGAGNSMVSSLTNTFKDWTDWLHSHPEKSRDFFKQAVADTSSIAKNLGDIVKHLFKFGQTMHPLLPLVSKLAGALANVPSLAGGGGIEDAALGYLGGRAGVRAYKYYRKNRGGAAPGSSPIQRVKQFFGGQGNAVNGIDGPVAPGSLRNPVAVFVTNGGGKGGPHGGTPVKRSPGVPEEKPSTGSRIRNALRRFNPVNVVRNAGAGLSEEGGFKSLGPLARGAGVIGTAIAGAAAMGQPGIDQSPGNRLKAGAQAIDPTGFATGIINGVLGTHIPSLTRALFGGVKRDVNPYTHKAFDPYNDPGSTMDAVGLGGRPVGTGTARGQANPLRARSPLPAGFTTRGTPIQSVHTHAPAAPHGPGLADALTGARNAGASALDVAANILPHGQVARIKGATADVVAATRSMGKGMTGSTSRANKSMSDAFANIRDTAIGKMGKTKDGIAAIWGDGDSGIVGNFTTKLNKVSNSVHTAFTGIYNEMTGWLKKIQGGTGAVVGAGQSVAAGIPSGGANKAAKKGARGMRIPGLGKRDTVEVRPGYMAAPGELIVNQHTEKRLDRMLGYHGTSLASEVEGEQRPHYLATGGRTGGLQPGISAAANRVLKQFPGLGITSTTSGGHAAGSYHYKGEAVDISGGYPLMNKAASWIHSVMGKSLTEGIHNPNLSVKFGKDVPPSFWGASTWAGHANHIHLAVAGALGAMAGLGGGMTHKLRARHAAGGGLEHTIGQRAINRMRARAQKKLDAAGGGGMAGQDPGITGKGQLSRRQVEKLWVSAGGSPSLAHLMANVAWAESGWVPTRRNPSGASGLWQILGQLVPGNIFDPFVNAKNAVAKYRSQGLGAWAASRAGWSHSNAPGAATGGRAPEWGGWHAGGLDKTFDRPTFIGVGEKGKEHVTVTPTGGRGGGGGIRIEKLVVYGNEDTKRHVKAAFHDLASELRLTPVEGAS